VNAFLAVKIRHAVFARGDGLAGTDFHAQLGAAALAKVVQNDLMAILAKGSRPPSWRWRG
jgi:hypothetical protein